MNKKRRNAPAKMSDIARLAGVSASTVSRALAGSQLVEKSKREEIVQLAQSRGYVVNTTARNLRLQRTQRVSVVIPLGHESSQSLTDPFFVEMLGHLADEITQRGFGMFLQKILPPMGDWLPQLIGSHQSDGILVIGQSTEHTALEAVAAHYHPLVVWGGHLDHQSYCTVGTDNVAGARVATEHLLKLGRRRIVFLGDASIPEMQLRYEGYKQALAYEAMRAFIKSGSSFDSVVCATDVIAMSAIRAITAGGLSVPKDIAVVGFDDIAMASHANPPLTTVHQDFKRGAHTMVDLLFRRIGGEDTPSATMPAELVVRESSGGG
jgi:DNA-binding LacI/PurR family transcriptional regulator